MGRGEQEQGVLVVRPYVGEILPPGGVEAVAEGKNSSARIYKLFLVYLKAGDFPGADMAVEFLQMGWTRARRHADHRGGRKCDGASGERMPRTEDAEKAAASCYERYVDARRHPEHIRQKEVRRERYESA